MRCLHVLRDAWTGPEAEVQLYVAVVPRCEEAPLEVARRPGAGHECAS